MNIAIAQEPILLTPPEAPSPVWGYLATPQGDGPHPTVILLHGSSGWRPEYVNLAQSFADSGFAALALDYYAETGGAPIGSAEKLQKWESWRQAVQNAGHFIRTVPSLNVDRIALIGYSRGAFLAVSVAASMPSVIALVDYYGGGGGGTLAPEDEVRGLPPLLIIHGGKDRIVPVSFAIALRDAVIRAGGDVTVHLFPEEDHAFNAPWAGTYSPGATATASNLMLSFLRKQFGL